MKRAFCILVIVALAGGGLWLGRQNIYQLIVTDHLNEEIDEFVIRDLRGNPLKLTDYEGKILVLDFWTTWCGACIRGLPDFQKVFAKYENNPEVAFLAVNTSHGGDSIDNVKAFIENNRYSFPFAYDADAVLSSKFKIKYYPTLMIIDRASKLRIKHIGYSKSLEDYEALISQYIEELLNETEYSSSEILNVYIGIGDLIFLEKVTSTLNRIFPQFPKRPSLGIACFLSLEDRVNLRCKTFFDESLTK